MPGANRPSSLLTRRSSAARTIAAVATIVAFAVESPLGLLAALDAAQAPPSQQQQPVRDSPPTGQVQPPPGLVGAQPLPAATVRQADLDLEAALKKESALIEGERVGPDGEAVGWVVEGGLLLTRDLWVALLRHRADALEAIRNMSREDKLALIAKLRAAAPELRDAFLNMGAAEGAALDPYRHERAAYERLLSDAAAADAAAADPSISAEQRGQLTARAADLRDRAEHSPWKFYADRRATFYGLLEASPENSLLGLYQDNWVVPNKYLFQTFMHTSYPLDPTERDDQLIADFDGYLDVNINRQRKLATEAEDIDEFEDLLEFLDAKYDRVHQLARAISTTTGMTFPALSVGPFTDISRSYELDAVVADTGRSILVAIVCIGTLPVPLVGAVVNSGFAAYELTYEGATYTIQWSQENDARLTAGVTGQQHVITADERTSARGGRLVLAIINAASTIPFAPGTVREAATAALERDATRFGVDIDLAATPAVQRGAQRARELGIRQTSIDMFLQRASTPDRETVMLRVRARGFKEGTEEFAAEVDAQIQRNWSQARPFAASLAQIAKLDDLAAAARAAGVTDQEIAAMFAAAQKTGILAMSQDLPQQLLSATLNRRGIRVVVDRAYSKAVNNGGGSETVADYPMHQYRQFWHTGSAPENVIRTDLNGLLTLRERLSIMGRGGVVTWTADELASLRGLLRRDDLASWYGFMSDENVFIRLFNDDHINTARRFLAHPNYLAIMRGQDVLPLARRLVPDLVPNLGTPVDPFSRYMLNGAAAANGLATLSRPGDGSLALELGLDPASDAALAGDMTAVPAPALSSRFITFTPTADQLEDWAVDRARSRFGGIVDWNTATLPDGRVAVTSPDGMRRVVVSIAPWADGQSRIDFTTEERQGRYIYYEYIRETNLRFDLNTSGTTLLPLEVPQRPTRVRPPPVPAADASPGAVAPVGAENAWTPRSFTNTTTAIERSAVASGPMPGIPITFNLTQPAAYSWNGSIVLSAMQLPLVQAITATTDGAEIEAPAAPVVRLPGAIGRLRSVGEALAAWLTPPRTLAARASRAGVDVRRQTARLQRASADAAQRPASVTIVLRSLGRSSGDAMEMTVFNQGPHPVRLTGDGIVLEPVANVTRQQLEGEMAALASAGRTTATLKGYCLEFLKQPPTDGIVFRLASEALQKRYAQVTPIFEASRRLRAAGKLSVPSGDPSSPADFFDAIRQWAIWTRQERFDERSYTRAFVQHARKNVEARGTAWTDRYEKAFTGLAPGRWQAVQSVLREADATAGR